MSDSQNPYKVLGLPSSASLMDVKARYLTLAKLHHPDRMMSAAPEERMKHEEIFKKISRAYNTINTGGAVGGSGIGGIGGDWDWCKIWESFMNDENIQKIKEIVKRAVELADRVREQEGFDGGTGEGSGEGSGEGYVPTKCCAHVMVTLEEIFKKKRKKIRVWVRPESCSADAKPVPVSVALECTRGATVFYGACPDGRDLMVTTGVVPHATYMLDTLINQVDLYHTREICLADYMSGGRWEIPYLDGTSVIYELAPFADITLPLVFKGMGMWREPESSLIVMWKLVLPKGMDGLEEFGVREIEILKIWGGGQTQTHLEIESDLKL